MTRTGVDAARPRRMGNHTHTHTGTPRRALRAVCTAAVAIVALALHASGITATTLATARPVRLTEATSTISTPTWLSDARVAAGTNATIVFEGWRGVPHSYAVVSQFLELQLLQRPHVALYHRDVPLYRHEWSALDVRRNASARLFTAQQDAALAAIPAPPASLVPDAVVRFSMPLDLSEPLAAALAPRSHRPRLFVGATTEFGVVPRGAMRDGAMPMDQSPAIIVTPSEWSARGFTHGGVPASRIALLPHGIDPDLHRPPADADERAQARQQFGWATVAGLVDSVAGGDTGAVADARSSCTGAPDARAEPFVFLNVGAMTGNKGVGDLVSAFASVVKRSEKRCRKRRERGHADEEARDDDGAPSPVLHPMLVLKGSDAMYSSGTLLADILAEPRHAKLVRAGRIRYLGDSLSFADMAALYRAADAYVSPYHAEGFNMPVLEAAASGLPVVTTEGGPTDAFTRPSFAVRVESEEVQGGGGAPDSVHLMPSLKALTVAMDSVLTDAAFRRSAARKGPKFVRKRFTWGHIADKLLDMVWHTPVSDPIGWATGGVDLGVPHSLLRVQQQQAARAKRSAAGAGAADAKLSASTAELTCGLRGATTAASVHCVAAEFGAMPGPGAETSATLVLAQPLLACEPLANDADDVAGRVVVVERGQCPFTTKALHAQAAGALAVVVVDTAEDPLLPLGGVPPDSDLVTVPVVSVPRSALARVRRDLEARAPAFRIAVHDAHASRRLQLADSLVRRADGLLRDKDTLAAMLAYDRAGALVPPTGHAASAGPAPSEVHAARMWVAQDAAWWGDWDARVRDITSATRVALHAAAPAAGTDVDSAAAAAAVAPAATSAAVDLCHKLRPGLGVSSATVGEACGLRATASPYLAASDTGASISRRATWAADFRDRARRAAKLSPPRLPRVRVGYYGVGFFALHPVGNLVSGLLRAHTHTALLSGDDDGAGDDAGDDANFDYGNDDDDDAAALSGGPTSEVPSPTPEAPRLRALVSCYFASPTATRLDEFEAGDSRAPLDAAVRHTSAGCDRVVVLPRGADAGATADSMRSDRLDVVVDLDGSLSAAGIAALDMRPAAIAMHFLGQPVREMARLGPHDYFVSDAASSCIECEPRLAIRATPGRVAAGWADVSDVGAAAPLLVLPTTFYTGDAARWLPEADLGTDSRARVGADVARLRSQQLLPNKPGTVVFAALNQAKKITPQLWHAWCDILSRVPRSVLWLPANASDAAVEHLFAEATARGIDPSRLSLASYEPDRATHLRRLRAADVYLDTTAFNAGSAAVDALMMGLPLITLVGTDVASRMASGIVRAAAGARSSVVRALVTHSLKEYADVAVRVAMSAQADPRLQSCAHCGGGGVAGHASRELQRLATDAAHHRHRDDSHASPLFDAYGRAAELERGMRAAVEVHAAQCGKASGIEAAAPSQCAKHIVVGGRDNSL